MKIGFVHSHYFYYDGHQYYSFGGLPQNILLRYVRSNDILFVFGRIKYVNQPLDNCSVISDPRIHILDYRKNRIHGDGFDLFILRMPCFISIVSFFKLHRSKVKIMTEVVGNCFQSYWHHSVLGKIIAPLLDILMKIAVFKSRYVTYVSKSYLQKSYKTKGVYLSCSDAYVTPACIKKIDSKIKSMEHKNSVSITLIGNLDVKYKNIIYGLKLCNYLREKKIVFSMKIIGQGIGKNLKKYVSRKKLNSYIEFLGSLNHNDVLNILFETDIYLHPSKVEGLPRSIVEAQANSCMVIASKVGGIPELINESCLFSCHSFKSLVKIFDSLNKEMLISQSKINYEKSQLFRKELLMNKWERFYREVVLE